MAFFPLSPALRGEGWGEGVEAHEWPYASTPSPQPSPPQSRGRGRSQQHACTPNSDERPQVRAVHHRQIRSTFAADTACISIGASATPTPRDDSNFHAAACGTVAST